MDFSILGAFEIRDGARVVHIRRAKPKALLALLVLRRNKVVSTGQLIDDLWDGQPPRSAAKALQTYVSQLRGLLPEGVLETRPPGYLLHVPPGEVDCERFEELVARGSVALEEGREREARRILTEALGLWRDGVLADLRYERFADAERARLEQLRLFALEQRIEADLALGRSGNLVSELQALVQENPLREAFTRQLMLALYRSGRQADALEVYRQTRRLLDELGLEPSRALQDLERSILQHEPSLDVETRSQPSRTEATPAESGPMFDRRSLVVGAAAVVASLAAGSVVLARRSRGGGLAGIQPNHIGIIDPATNAIVDEVPVGLRPRSIAVGRDAVWVANVADRSLTKIDLRQRIVVATVSLNDQTPTGIAAAADAVWVAHGLAGRLSRVDPQFERVTHTLQVVEQSYGLGSVAGGRDSVWAVYGDSTIARVDPARPRVAATGLAGAEPRGIVIAGSDIWILNSGEGDTSVARYGPETFVEGPLDVIGVGRDPVALAPGEDAIWVAHASDDIVTRIDLDGAVHPIRVDGGASALAVGPGSVWAASSKLRIVTRIDPEANAVVETLDVGSAPAGIAVDHGLVWIAAQTP